MKLAELAETPYQIRIMGCIVIVELFVLAVFLLWPVPPQEEVFQDIEQSEADITVEDAQITKQESSPPPPPKPMVPVPVPNDEVIEEEIPTLEDIDITEYVDPLSEETIGQVGDSDKIASNPQSPPSVVRIVEANQPDAAKKAGIRARIWVNFLVNREGSVEDASISRIELYDEQADSYKLVDHVNYGLPEATLTAALQWKFRPARNDGEPVKAYVEHIFSFGI